MLPRALFRAAALQGRQQQLLSPSRARVALSYETSAKFGAYWLSEDLDPRTLERAYSGWGRSIKMLRDLVEYLGFATASMELPKDLRVLGGVHLLNRLDKLRPPVEAKAKKSVHHLIRLCRKQHAGYVEKTYIRQKGVAAVS
ncbi:hypothetical protein PG995_014471 [Apiospora arundinis]